MKIKNKIQVKFKMLTRCLCVIIFLCTCSYVNAQISSVTMVQNMNFGAFYPGSNGGTVTISTAATRSATGDVVLLNQGPPCLQAIFDIEAPSGTIVSILNGPDATLTGSNGGTMSLRIGNSNPGSPFTTIVSPPGRTSVSIGATLTVGSSATVIPGSYSGTFSVTFNNE